MSRIQPVTAYAAVCAGCKAIGPLIASQVRPMHSEAHEIGQAQMAAERLAREAGWFLLADAAVCPTCRKAVAAKD